MTCDMISIHFCLFWKLSLPKYGFRLILTHSLATVPLIEVHIKWRTMCLCIMVVYPLFRVLCLSIYFFTEFRKVILEVSFLRSNEILTGSNGIIWNVFVMYEANHILLKVRMYLHHWLPSLHIYWSLFFSKLRHCMRNNFVRETVGIPNILKEISYTYVCLF